MKMKVEILKGGNSFDGTDYSGMILDLLAYYQSNKTVTVLMPCESEIHGKFKIVVSFPEGDYRLIVESCGCNK